MVVLLALVSNGQDTHARRVRNFVEHDVARDPKGTINSHLVWLLQTFLKLYDVTASWVLTAD